jgi:hypothetical protein
MPNIFRTIKRKLNTNETYEDEFRSTTNSLIQNHKTHDNNFPRARQYSLDSVLYFSILKGQNIKQVIENDFDYFLWFARKIKGFTYDHKVLDYAHECLKTLENLGDHNNPDTFIRQAKEQVRMMLAYEYELDCDNNKNLRDGCKLMINVKFYRTIYNQPIEKLIRQYFEKINYSNEFRRKTLNELRKSMNSNS